MIRILPAIFFSLFFSVQISAQQVPNGSFETWTDGEPDSWKTSNQNIAGLVDFTMVTRDMSDPHQGTASAKLSVVTKTIPFIGTYTLPGVITLGKLNFDPIAQTASIKGGSPFAGLPQKLTGYFKYLPFNNDTCAMGWGLTRWNNGVRDTIGYAAIDTMGTFNSWTYFEIPLKYRVWEIPDTVNILIINSNPLDGVNHTGTAMWIDDLSFVYGALGVEGTTFSKELNIYAEPDARQLILSSAFPKQENLDIRLYTIAGIEAGHWKRSMQQSTENLDLNALSPGTYVIRIISGNRLIDSRKITILY